MQAKEIQGQSLLYLAVEPDNYDPDAEYPVVILLHGYGASMSDLAGLSPSIHSTGYVFIFPNAPIPMQVGLGTTGYAWTPPQDSGTEEDEVNSQEMLEILFDEVQERYNVEGGNILLGGFSQGGMMTYRCGLTRPDLFAGLLILSSRLPTDAAISENLPEDRNQPIFVAHGTSDMMISVNDARRSREFLESEGYAPEYHEYVMGHEINQAVIDDMVVWLGSVLPPGPEN